MQIQYLCHRLFWVLSKTEITPDLLQAKMKSKTKTTHSIKKELDFLFNKIIKPGRSSIFVHAPYYQHKSFYYYI